MKLPDKIPALVVGAGPIGLAAAISARRRGVQALVIDAGPIASSIVRYPVGMTFFTTPERLEIGDHPLPTTGRKTTREEALAYYRGVARAEELHIVPYARMTGAVRMGDEFEVTVVTRSGAEVIRTPKLVMATGYFDHPNMLDIPGEILPHVSHWFEEPHTLVGQRIVIVGGKNSAIESALQAWRVGAHVTLVHRGAELTPSVKYWLRPDFENRVAAGEIEALFESRLVAITESAAIVRTPDGEHELPADRVFLLTGYHPDYDLLTSLGVELDSDTGRATLDPVTLESNVPGLHLAGSVSAGNKLSDVFIENGRFDGEKIFGDAASRQTAERRYAESPRPIGE